MAVENIPHKCPVCDGTGKVSRPTHVAGDQPSWSDSSAGPHPCSACNGIGIVWEHRYSNSLEDAVKLTFH